VTATRTLSDVLRTRRLDRGLTLNEMGKRLQLANGNFIGMVERGERLPSDAKLLDMAKVLELDGRELLALKYRQIPDSAVHQLFSPPEPRHKHIRRLLLTTCTSGEEMAREFGLSEKTALERIVFGYLVDFVLTDAVLDSREFATLRKRLVDLGRRRARDPEVSFDSWWFEEEGEAFIAFARRQFVGWSLDLLELTLTIQHSESPTDRSVIPLIDVELRDRLIHSVGREVATRGGLNPRVTLEDLLRAEGLTETDTEEILALVAFKKARRRRAEEGA
jgi:transcriptional regulator with XRE-family HTH domain